MARSPWSAAPFKGREWGIFDADSCCWVYFGTKREVLEMLRKLEKGE